jgi:hypothetical protein
MSACARSGPMPGIDCSSRSEAMAIAAMDPNSATNAFARSIPIPGARREQPDRGHDDRAPADVDCWSLLRVALLLTGEDVKPKR